MRIRLIDQTPEDELDCYDAKKTEHKKLKERWNAAVTEEDMRKYCTEFIDTFQSFVRSHIMVKETIGVTGKMI